MLKSKKGFAWVISIIFVVLIGYRGGELLRHSEGELVDMDHIIAAESDKHDESTGKASFEAEFAQSPASPSPRATMESIVDAGITVIGDSVVIGAAPFLEERLPNIVIDGKVSRQMRHAQAIGDELRAQGKLGKRVIIELGTNGPFKAEQLRSLLQSLDDKEVLLVNTRVPKDWQDTVNGIITEVAEEFSNTTIIDWHALSEGKDELFYKDGVHLNPEGAEYFARMLIDALKNE